MPINSFQHSIPISLQEAGSRLAIAVFPGLSWEQLRDEVPLPCIAHWNQRHFVVIYGIKKQRRVPCIFSRTPPEGLKSNRSRNYLIYVADPASGLLKYTEKEFLRCWYSNQKEGIKEGAVLLLEPTQEFFLL